MAHFAEIDNTNTVLRVVVISNEDLLDNDGIEQESIGVQVCKNIFGENTNWVQTSYTGKTRRKYASIGDKYEPTLDIFYRGTGLYPSWVLNSNFEWEPPTPKPDDGNNYEWDEPTLSWVTI